MAGESKLGDGLREFWGATRREVTARMAYVRGEITAEQLREMLGPRDPLFQAIRDAPDGTLGAMIRKSGQEILTAVTRRISKSPGEPR